jgi:Ca-activated chloride channel family protein
VTRSLLLFASSLLLAGGALALGTARDPDFWTRAERRADVEYRSGDFDAAAKGSTDPVRRGDALYRSGNFKDASAAFSGLATPEAWYNRGNALVFQGKYDDAITSYNRALELKAGWTDAVENRAVAVVRRDRLKTTGGDETGGQVKADKIVFEKGKNQKEKSDDELTAGDPLNDEQLRGLWLRRVQTKPADFLRAKFAFQMQAKGSP